MKVAYWTNILSPHQLPLAREIAKRVGEGNYQYIYRDGPMEERLGLGWNFAGAPEWCRRGTEDDPALMEADLVYSGGLRPLDLIARRIAAGKKTYYVTERWFKPLVLLGMNLPGKWRMAVPAYRKMAKRMVEMLNNPLCKVLAIGPWSKKDMIELGVREEQIWDWGYFVEECKVENVKCKIRGVQMAPLKVLWVGRMLRLKHVDTIIRAVGELAVGFSGSGERVAVGVSGSGASTRSTRSTRFNISLDIYGTGPEEARLKRLGAKYGDAVRFHPPVPIDEVRGIMRAHDIYVLASDENEGWGAVVNEALMEGMRVLGTFEAGASAAMLPKERLFHAGDWRALAELIVKESRGDLPECSIGDWTAEKAAERLVGSEGVESEGVGE